MNIVSPQKQWKQRRRQQSPERNLHTVVAGYFTRCLPDDVYWYPVPNGAVLGLRQALMMKRTGQLKNGVPDLAIIYRGRALFIELKSAKGRITDDQRQAHKDILLAGADVAICRSLEDVVAFLDVLQIPMKGRPQ